jgi:hypothetical protein
MAWRRDVITLGDLVFSATIASSSGVIIEVLIDRLRLLAAQPCVNVRVLALLRESQKRGRRGIRGVEFDCDLSSTATGLLIAGRVL